MNLKLSKKFKSGFDSFVFGNIQKVSNYIWMIVKLLKRHRNSTNDYKNGKVLKDDIINGKRRLHKIVEPKHDSLWKSQQPTRSKKRHCMRRTSLSEKRQHFVEGTHKRITALIKNNKKNKNKNKNLGAIKTTMSWKPIA